MSSAAEVRIKDIEAEIARTQKNKATMAHLCLLKARLAKLRREILEQGAVGSGGGGSAGAAKRHGFAVRKTGHATIGLVGFPSVGKSSLLTKLTGHYSEAAEYEFTTLKTVPGIIHYRGARIQLLDLPGIIEGARDGKGRGLQVISVAKTVDLILIVLSATRELRDKTIIEDELEKFGIRLNKNPPAVAIRKKDRGGVTLTPLVPQSVLTLEIVRATLAEYRVLNADVRLNTDATIENLIDVLDGNCAYIPAIYVLNKIDRISIPELELFMKLPHLVPIGAKDQWNFDTLLKDCWQRLDLIRIYAKPRGQHPDYEEPVVLKRSTATVEQFCLKLHKSVLVNFKYAIVWGASAKFVPQKVGKEHLLFDEDIIQVVRRSS